MRKIKNLEEYSYNPVVNWTKKEPTPVNPMEDFRRETAARDVCSCWADGYNTTD